MSLLLLLSPSVPPPDPVTVLGASVPSDAFSPNATMWTLGSWDGTTYEVCPSESPDIQVGDFCVLVIHFHASPAYVGVSLALSRNKWTTHVVHSPNNPDSPYDGVGTIVASRVYTGTSSDCFRVNFPSATNAIARVFSFTSALRMSAIGPISQRHQYGNNPYPGDFLHLGLTILPALSSCVYTSAADCQGGLAYTSMQLSQEEMLDYDPGASNSRPLTVLSGMTDPNVSDLALAGPYTVFPEATRSKTITVIPIVAMDSGIRASAEIVSVPAVKSIQARAVIENNLVSRFGATGAEAEIVGTRVNNGSFDVVSLQTNVAAELSLHTVSLGSFSASAELQRSVLNERFNRHPRNSDFHTHHTLTDQIVTTEPLLSYPAGSVLHDVLLEMWDEYSLLSSLNRWPKSFAASAEVV